MYQTPLKGTVPEKGGRGVINLRKLLGGWQETERHRFMRKVNKMPDFCPRADLPTHIVLGTATLRVVSVQIFLMNFPI